MWKTLLLKVEFLINEIKWNWSCSRIWKEMNLHSDHSADWILEANKIMLTENTACIIVYMLMVFVLFVCRPYDLSVTGLSRHDMIKEHNIGIRPFRNSLPCVHSWPKKIALCMQIYEALNFMTGQAETSKRQILTNLSFSFFHF